MDVSAKQSSLQFKKINDVDYLILCSLLRSCVPEQDPAEITTIHGCLIIHGTRIKVASLHQITLLKPDKLFCEYKYALLIYDNPDLTEIQFDSKLKVDSKHVLIRLNPKLSSKNITGASLQVDLGDKKDCVASKVETNSQCKRIIGDVLIEELSSDVWGQIEEIVGSLSIKNTEIEFLNMLQDLKIVGWKSPALVISDNKKLVDISTLLTMNISSEDQPIEISNNPNICHNVVERKKLQEWLKKMGTSVNISDKCLESCAGGRVTLGYLAGLDKHCNVIKGSLTLEGMKDLPNDIAKLEQLEQVNGLVLVWNNTGLQDLSFLKNLKQIRSRGNTEYKYGLMIYGNPNLHKIQLDKKLQINSSEIFIRANPNLTQKGIEGPKLKIDLGDETDCVANVAEKSDTCKTVIGDIRYKELSPATWQRIKTVEGTVRVENTDVETLDALKDLKIVGWKTPALTVVNNKKLVDVSALLTMDIVSSKPLIKINSNPNICHGNVERSKLEEWLEKNEASITFSNLCMKSCKGGEVTQEYLTKMDKHCNAIEGDLIIAGMDDLYNDTEKLLEVEKISGRLVITENKAITSLDFLRNLKEVGSQKPSKYKHALMIYGNPNLEDIQFNEKLLPDPNVVFIRLNPKLTQEGVESAAFEVFLGDEEDCFAKVAEKNTNCKTVIGDVEIEELSPTSWQHVENVEGTLSIENTYLETLDAIKQLNIFGWKTPALIISNNDRLTDISALLTMHIDSKDPILEISNNTNICANIMERETIQEWLASRGASVVFHEQCLKSCAAGVITNRYLAGLDKHCNVLHGDVIISGVRAFYEAPFEHAKVGNHPKISGKVQIKTKDRRSRNIIVDRFCKFPNDGFKPKSSSQSPP
ncbi:hypothetical protein Y032_0212g2224 [Ancylostoma ceylanicum]|uniref:Receptor L-domain domain-containing protein n=1 Tax=Ancylostoma ceylanicum TaxID=53326 RepID=A0A016SJL0_9BILA|nr:hypothetical protein Y032_0212g2224 [Ancylostoma ceylanicum]